ncbi:unnamed protein product, partial [Ectocarpus sp. 12 AP-2014]
LDRKVTVSKSPLRIAELLDEIFKGTDLEYEILSNQIVVKRKGETVYSGKIPEKSVEISNFQTSLNGNVLDEDGNPLPGASVVAKGTTVGTTTDFDGNFNITLPIGVTTVQVSYLGYRSKEVDVAGKETITISLEPDAAALEEVIVVGYGSLAKTKVTGSVISIDTETIVKVPALTAEGALIGQVAGVQVQEVSGEPGAAPNIRVMGSGSISAGNDP